MPPDRNFWNGSLVPSSSATSSLPTNVSEPHRLLNDLFQNGHLQRGGRFSAIPRATILRQLFQTIWQKPEWIGLFGVERETIPHLKSLHDWVTQDENGDDRSWSLSEAQERAEAGRVRAGKSPLRVVKRGRTCGKVLQRYERTYTCK